jgi:hypothetical protein
MEEDIKKIKELVGNDKIEEAIANLKLLFQGDYRLDEILLQSAKYEEIKTSYRSGIINFETANISMSQVRKAILDSLNTIEKNSQVKSSPKLRKIESPRIYLIIGILIMIFVSIGIIFNNKQGRTVGIDGNNNDNNKVIITDKYIENNEIPYEKRLDEEYFERALNPRFGFAFSYPLSWERVDSENGDGHTIVNPKNTNITILGFGGWYDEEFDGPVYSIKNDRFLNEEEVVFIRESGIYEFSWSEENGKTVESKEGVYGEKACWVSKGVKYLAIGSAHAGRRMCIICSAPEDKFDEFEELFIKIISSARFLKDYG